MLRCQNSYQMKEQTMSDDIKKEDVSLTEEFVKFANDKGIKVTEPIFDYQIHRCEGAGKDRSGWYVGKFITTKKDLVYLQAVCGDWVSGDSFRFQPNVSLTRADQEALRDEIKALKKRQEEEKDKLKERAIEDARELLTASQASPEHGYLEAKKVKPYGITERGGNLFIPFRSVKGSLTGGQRIRPDGTKWQILGTVLGESMFIFGKLDEKTKKAYLCEGWATGASVYEATGKPVICAFTASNLKPVAQVVKRYHPKTKVVVLGDDDHSTEGNPGRKHGDAAARVFRTKPVYPVFRDYDGKNTTDWNDLHVCEGLDEVKRQVESVANAERDYIALGMNASYHFFYSKKNHSIMKFKSFTPDAIQQLIQKDAETLASMYPREDGSGICWEQARAEIIADSYCAGIFTPNKVRGVGVWLDQDEVIINTGQHLIVNRVHRDLLDIDSKYVYVSSAFGFSSPKSALTTFECEKLLQAIRLFSWESPDYVALLAGWLALARIAGALPVRPRIWITGGEGTGKSTLFEKIIKLALGEGFLAAGGQSTAAGVRQTLRADSIPLLYDEFETETQNYIQQGMIELIRQSWSSTTSRQLKGTPGGVPQDYDPQFTALVSSIKTSLNNAQDQGRFSVLELTRITATKDDTKRLYEACSSLSRDSFGQRLFARSARMLPVILESFEVLRSVISTRGQSNRYADQVGMLMAGYHSLVSDNAVTVEQAEKYADNLRLQIQEIPVDNRKDEELCLNHLLTTVVKFNTNYQGSFASKEATILDLVQSPDRDELQKYGMKIVFNKESKKPELAIVDRSTELERIFRNTHWKNWNLSLSRLKGVTQQGFVKIYNMAHRCIKIPIETIGIPELAPNT